MCGALLELFSITGWRKSEARKVRIAVTVHEIFTPAECTVTVAELMDELREIHLGLKPKRRTGPIVGERLQAAYEKAIFIESY
jgi:hypothetical protein